MNAEKQKTATTELFDIIYKNVKMNSDRIVDIIKKANDSGLREELTKQLDDFEERAGKICVALLENGEEAKEESLINKIGAKIDTAFGTLMNSDTSKLAEILIESYGDSATQLTKAIREYENTNCSEESLGMARDVLALQETCIERMKCFL